MFLYIANWKMGFSFGQALEFCETHYDDFMELSKLPGKKIVLCPSFVELGFIAEGFGHNDSGQVEIGAQDCSNHHLGAYTGQIPAESLYDIGCSYCIVGHSERRKYASESSEVVAQKVKRLIDFEIMPVVCVGEYQREHSDELVEKALLEQLLPVFKLLKNIGNMRICVAYEPVWTIGTSQVPDNEQIQKVFDFITAQAKQYAPSLQITLLYGGSVDENTAKKLRDIGNIGGFLIGSASLDFKKFEKIVHL